MRGTVPAVHLSYISRVCVRGTVSPSILVSSNPVKNLLCSVIIEDSLGNNETIRPKLELIREL